MCRWLDSTETRHTVNRHRPCPNLVEEDVCDKLVTVFTLDSKSPVNVLRTLFNPVAGQFRQLIIVVAVVPRVQALGIVRPHFTGYHVRVIAIVRPRLLITKDFIVLCVALTVDFLIQDGHFPKVREHRIVEVKPRLTRPHPAETLLIAMVYADCPKDEDIPVFHCRIAAHLGYIRGHGVRGNIALRACIIGCTRLDDLIHVDGNASTAKILRTLQTAVGTCNAELVCQQFSIPRTASCICFQDVLNGDSLPQLVDGDRRNLTQVSR